MAPPPPPITPAPRRFLPQANSDNPRTTPRLPPLRPQHQAFTPQAYSSAQRQFASIPKFSFGPSNRKSLGSAASPRPPPFSSSSPFNTRQASQAVAKHGGEDIEEASSDQEQLPVPEKRSDLDSDDLLDADLDESRAEALPKRRRLHPPSEAIEEQIIISSSPPAAITTPTTPSPAAPTSPSPPSTPPPLQLGRGSTASSSIPRFHFTLPTHSSPSSASTRPSFILPPPPQSPPTKLPAALTSPHRREQKYLTGGLASTVRDWVFETGQESSKERSEGRRGSEESWDVRIRVADVQSAKDFSGGVTMVQEQPDNTGDHRGRRWLLMGSPKNGPGEAGIGHGSIIGIAKPMWEIELTDHQIWHVGVEWKVLRR